MKGVAVKGGDVKSAVPVNASQEMSALEEAIK